MAATAAALIGLGTSKCGCPMLRLMGSFRLRASSKTLRMPEDSMWRMRSAIQRIRKVSFFGRKTKIGTHAFLLFASLKASSGIPRDEWYNPTPYPGGTSTMNRRRFLAASAAAATTAVACAYEKERVFPIVDTHQHLWDLGKFKLPWLAKNESLKADYLPKDYADATAKLCTFKVGGAALPGKIAKTVYMEVDVDPSQQDQEAEYVIGLCNSRETPMVAAVISGRPASDGFKKYISAYKDSKTIKGVRQVLHGDGTPKGYCLDAKFIRGVQLLGELGMSYDICIRPGELLD